MTDEYLILGFAKFARSRLRFFQVRFAKRAKTLLFSWKTRTERLSFERRRLPSKAPFRGSSFRFDKIFLDTVRDAVKNASYARQANSVILHA